MRLPRLWALLPTLIVGASCSPFGGERAEPPRTVESVDIERYLGTWYEIASRPNRFQQDCVATKAIYTAREDGRIGVRNECRSGSFAGAERSIEGVAWPVEPGSARLRIQFFWPWRGDYWILEIDPAYQWAVVGHPSRRYLWILSRTPTLDEAVYAELLRRIEAHGYAREELRRTPQPVESPAPSVDQEARP